MKIHTLATKHFKASMVMQHYLDMVHQAVHIWGDDYGLRIPRTSARHVHHLFSPTLPARVSKFFCYIVMKNLVTIMILIYDQSYVFMCIVLSYLGFKC